MSDTFNSSNDNQTFQNRPEHHLHTDSEALPAPKDTNFKDSNNTNIFDATRNTNIPSGHGDSQFGTTDSKTSTGAGRSTNDYPDTPANSRYGEGVTGGAHSTLSDTTKPSGAGHKYDTKDILEDVDTRHKKNALGATNFDSKGVDTDNQFRDSGAPGHHGYTSFTGSAPGETRFKPADTVGGPLHFQHALGGQDPIWTGTDTTTKLHNTSTLPGQTSGTHVPEPSGAGHKDDSKEILKDIDDRHKTNALGATNYDSKGTDTDDPFRGSDHYGYTSIWTGADMTTSPHNTSTLPGQTRGSNDLDTTRQTHHAPLPPTDKTHISGQTGTKHTTDNHTPAHHAASKVPGHDAAVNLKNTTEDRTHMHPSHTTGTGNAKRTDDGVKFTGDPAKDTRHGPHTTGAETKPGFGDKVIGNTEKIIGKMTKDRALEEKGAIRAETGQPRN